MAALLNQTQATKPNDRDEIDVSRSSKESSGEQSPLLWSNRKRKEGLGLYSAACYHMSLLGVLPMLALPAAVAAAEVFGVMAALLLVVVIWYTAIQQTEAWVIAETFYPHEATNNPRQPLPMLAYIVGGIHLRRFVSFMLDFTLLTASVPYILLASTELQSSIAALGGASISYCYLIMIVIFAITPLVWLATPIDLKIVAWAGAFFMLVTAILLLTILVQNITDAHSVLVEAGTSTGLRSNSTPIVDQYAAAGRIWPTWMAISYGFSAMTFQFNVHPVLLTVQGHMKRRSDRRNALFLACAGVTLLYAPVVSLAYFRYGVLTSTNLLVNLPVSPSRIALSLLIAGQILMCFILGANCLFLDLEEVFKLPPRFGCLRVSLRTSVMLLLLLICETLPNFSITVQLVGGIIAMPFIFVFPVTFNLILKKRCLHPVSVCDALLAALVVLLGVTGSILSLAGSVHRIMTDFQQTVPCYVALFVPAQTGPLTLSGAP